MYFSMRGVLRGMGELFTISLFVIPLGIAFGVSATEKGMSVLQATTMSFFVFSAAAQFATIDLFSSASPVSILIVAFAVSTRLILLSASLSTWLNQLSRPRRLTTLTTLSDANFADGFMTFQREEKDIGRLFGGGLAIWLAWVIGTIIGGVVGQSFGDLNRFGIAF